MIAVICKDIRFYKDFMNAQGLHPNHVGRFKMVSEIHDIKGSLFTEFVYPHRACHDKELEQLVKQRIR